MLQGWYPLPLIITQEGCCSRNQGWQRSLKHPPHQGRELNQGTWLSCCHVQGKLRFGMQIRQMESCIENWHCNWMPIWTRHLGKCMGIGQIRCHLPGKRLGTNCWTRNLIWRWPLNWRLPEGYWESPLRCLQGTLRQQCILWGMPLETKHGHPRRKSCKSPSWSYCLKNCFSPLKNRRTSFSRCCVLKWWIKWRRSLIELKCHELNPIRQN